MSLFRKAARPTRKNEKCEPGIFRPVRLWEKRGIMGKKKVLVSACLLGRNCKYDGGNNYREDLVRYLEEKAVSVVEVCPEVEGGLPVPRIPVELVNGVAVNRAGKNVDDCFRAGVKTVLGRIRGEEVVAAILQPRSPSCGVEQVYDGSFSGKLIPGEGMFAKALRGMGIPVFDAAVFAGERGDGDESGKDIRIRQFEELIR